MFDIDAVEYFNLFMHYETLTKKMRKQITQYIFEDCEILLNETHEGLYNDHTIVLGAYVMEHPFSCPIMLSAESSLPIASISKPIPNLKDTIYACPHGGGYSLSNLKNGHYNGETSQYKIIFDNNATMITSDIRNLIYTYRTNTTDIWLRKLNFGVVSKTLSTHYNFKL